ncbi:MAG: phosphatidylinositol-specific phospholipase C/glycerophosphodiester phosphodiesterase family protein [Balneolaceae bacterium]
MIDRRSLYSFCILLLAFLYTACDENGEIPPDREIYVWSHNDYEQSRPLFQALDFGYQMIEADLHLIDGQLVVTHDSPEDPDQTPLFEELYLKPLAEIIEQNGGVVLPDSELSFYLVIDVKTGAENTFEAILKVIEPYHELFTRKADGAWIEGPIHLLISGNRPELTADSPDRIAFLDGRIPDIGQGLSSDLYPVISDNWNNHFDWNGTGQMSADEYNRLTSYVKDVHAEDKRIRFWATPDRESVWEVLLDAGVDIINVDDHRGLREFLDQHEMPMKM